MQQGTIKTLNPKGFGFIAQEGVDKDLFFHATALDGITFEELNEGDHVQFEVVEGEKGPAAANVSRVAA